MSTFKYTAIIIEPRCHKALSFVLNNFLENLSEEWGFIIFHGNKNKDFIHNILDGELNNYKNRIQKLINLNVNNLFRNDYSELLKKKEFYDNIDTEIFLIFQVDTLIIKENKDLINNFLEYDYVGAPWKNGSVGNGGLSLRKKSKMLKIIDKVDKNFKYNEDEYFSLQEEVSLYRACFKEAQSFSVETVFHEIPFGIHNCYNHLSEEEWLYLANKYPDLDTLKKLNSPIDYNKIYPFTIIYNTSDNNFNLLEQSLLSIKEYLDFTPVFEIIIYVHDIYFENVFNILDETQLKNTVTCTIIPLHYNYHGFIKQMTEFTNSFKIVKTKYIVYLKNDFILTEELNLNSMIDVNGKLKWKFKRIKDFPNDNDFIVWKKASEDSNLISKNSHYSNNNSNNIPYLFTTKSLEDAYNKFNKIHNCDYESFCYQRCIEKNINIESQTNFENNVNIDGQLNVNILKLGNWFISVDNSGNLVINL